MPSALPEGNPWPENNLIVPLVGGDRTFHAYVHIPFCEVRCGYCDFNTYTQSEIGDVKSSAFHAPLIQEIAFSADVLAQSGFPNRQLSSIFFGGGTPSLFLPEQIAAIVTSLSETFGLAPNCEITMEANPESLMPHQLPDLALAGINRISLGVQSFDPQVLQVLDRQHDPSKVAPLVSAAKAAGFRVSADLIFGAPEESLESWGDTVEAAIDLGTEHISAYSLIVEPGTKLSRQISAGQLAMVDEDLNAEKYELAAERFEAAGLGWYEISNFGEPSSHNIAYWQSQDWWGYGPGAHSHLAGNRFWNRKHPLAYQKAVAQGSPAQAAELLTQRQILEEQLMLGLRTKFGVERKLLSDLGVAPEAVAQKIAHGLITLHQDRLVVTERGRLLADRLVVDFVN